MIDRAPGTDLAAAFRDGAVFLDGRGRRLHVERLAMGELGIESGSVAVGDPIAEVDAVAPPRGTVPPGRYRVDLSVVRYPGGQRFVAAGRLTFRDAPVVAWVACEHPFPLEGDAAFADGAYEVGGIRAITVALHASYVDAFSHALVAGAGGEVAAFTAGDGGGEYWAFWGMTAGGEPVQLCLDFELLAGAREAPPAAAW